MRYFFGNFPGAPGVNDVLLIESGSPGVGQRVLEKIGRLFPGARYHLLTCWPVPPVPSAVEGSEAEGSTSASKTEGPETTPEHRFSRYQSVFRASDYPTGLDKIRLLFSLARRRWRVLAILCTGEPLLWRWKLLALAIFPSKVLIANENADFFWLDWAHRSNLRQFLAVRWGVNRDEIAATLFRALVFPFSLLFLLLTALYLYTRRWRRLLVWKFRPAQAPASTARPPDQHERT